MRAWSLQIERPRMNSWFCRIVSVYDKYYQTLSTTFYFLKGIVHGSYLTQLYIIRGAYHVARCTMCIIGSTRTFTRLV